MPMQKASFETNFPEAAFELNDIRTLNLASIQARIDAGRTNPVLFTGCAPCQPFSNQNTVRPSLNRDERVPVA